MTTGRTEERWDPYKDSLERRLLTIREYCNEVLQKKPHELEDDEAYYLAELIKREARF